MERPWMKRKCMAVSWGSVMGIAEWPIRAYFIGEKKPYAQYPESVSVVFMEPRQRTPRGCTMHTNDSRFLTLDVDGIVLFDSRTIVPCDMATWERLYAEHSRNPPVLTISGGDGVGAGREAAIAAQRMKAERIRQRFVGIDLPTLG